MSELNMIRFVRGEANSCRGEHWLLAVLLYISSCRCYVLYEMYAHNTT